MSGTIPFTPDQSIRALSWKQPYAELMLHEKIETRTWPTKYRGWVLICASKIPYDVYEIMSISGIKEFGWISELISLSKAYDDCGKAIAIGRLIHCRPMLPGDEFKCFVKHYPDLYCHFYSDVQAIVPFP